MILQRPDGTIAVLPIDVPTPVGWVVVDADTHLPTPPTPPPVVDPRPFDASAWQALADAQTLGDVREAAETAGGA